MSIGQNIRRLREEHGLSQSQLGQIAGVTDKAVSTWEIDSKVPRMGAVQKMADFFNVPKSAILDDAPSSVPLHVAMTPALQTLESALEVLNKEGQEKLLDYADDLVRSGKYKKYNPNRVGEKEA